MPILSTLAGYPRNALPAGVPKETSWFRAGTCHQGARAGAAETRDFRKVFPSKLKIVRCQPRSRFCECSVACLRTVQSADVSSPSLLTKPALLVWNHCSGRLESTHTVGSSMNPPIGGTCFITRNPAMAKSLRSELPRPEHFPHGLRLEPLTATNGFPRFQE
jgi:hypothetical protein